MLDINTLDFSKSNGLISIVAQHVHTKDVLMVAWANRQAVEKSLATGLLTFYSRSRQSLWTKGETSGNFLKIVSLLPDCDGDTLLAKVLPHGPACHTGTDTCFGNAEGGSAIFLDYLQAYIHERRQQMPEGSYTTKLFNAGIARQAQKVGEEAVELVIEAMRPDTEKMKTEGADLLYHLLVLLSGSGLDVSDLIKVLESRHK